MRMWLWKVRASKTRHILRIGEVRARMAALLQHSLWSAYLRCVRRPRHHVLSCARVHEVSHGVR
jgi:hypothetical protein